MKRTLCLLLAAFLLLTPQRSAAKAAESEAAPTDIFDPPVVRFTAENVRENDKTFHFAADCGSAAAYERQRRGAYDRLYGEIAALYEINTLDENVLRQLGMDDLIPLLYPVVLLAEATVDGVTVFVDTFPADTEALTLSLNRHILPALADSGMYRHEAFAFSLHFTVAIRNAAEPTRASGSVERGPYACPATAYLRYNVPEDAVNPNPSFMFLPYGDYTLLYPTRTGYTFAGWVDGRTGSYVSTVPGGTMDRSYTSYWTPRVYKVSYVLSTRPGYFIYVKNDGNPQTHVYGDETPLYDLTPPSGYVFGGWYADPEFKGRRMRSIPADLPGDLVLYAKWQTPAEAEAEAVAAGHWGDLDNDGNVTAADARIALRAAVQLETLTAWQIKRADLAGNGVISAATARDLLRIAVGLDTVADLLKFYGTL